MNNKKITETTLLRLIILFFVITSWFGVTIMSILNISDTLVINTLNHFDLVVLFFIIPFFICALFYLLLSIKKIFIYFFLLFLVTIIISTLIIITATKYHRDFYTLFYQLILLLFICTIVQFPLFVIINNRINIIKTFSITAWILLGSCLLWIMLMGYSIATRTEPRWIESLVYNMINVLILSLLAFSISRLQQQVYKVFYIHTGYCKFNERNLSMNLSEREIQILTCFSTSEDHCCTCCSIRKYLHNSGFLEQSVEYDCEICMKERWSAINCKFYRNIKNQLTNLKKSLELTEIGTIVNVSENFREQKEKGWKLKFFNDVIVSTLPKKSKEKS